MGSEGWRGLVAVEPGDQLDATEALISPTVIHFTTLHQEKRNPESPERAGFRTYIKGICEA